MRKLIAAVVVLAALSGCGRQPIEYRSFVMAVEVLGFTAEDISDNYTSEVSSAVLAKQDKLGIHTEYYKFVTETDSKSTFVDTKEKIKQLNPSIELSSSSKSSDKYTGRTDKMTYIVSRVDNTLIYAEAIRDSEKELEELLEKLNY